MIPEINTETNTSTNIEDFSGLASRVSGLLGVLENIIGGNPEDSADTEVDPLEQIRTDIAELRSEVKGLPKYGDINKLQAQVASLPSKEDIVSSVLARVPEPNCSCKKDELNRPLGGGGGSDIITTTSDQLSGGG